MIYYREWLITVRTGSPEISNTSFVDFDEENDVCGILRVSRSVSSLIKSNISS